MLERQIVLAGRPSTWTMGRILIAKPLLTGVAALLALWFIGLDPVLFRIVVGILAVLLAFFVPDLLVYSRAIERQQKMELELPDTLDQMTISVEAGLGFEAAMAKAATNGNGPLAEELVRTLQDMSIGRTRRSSYEALADRTTCKDLRRFVRAVIQADIYGVPIVDVLRVQAAEMRLKRRQRAEEKAMQVPVKVLFPLLFCILPVLFIVLLAPAVLHAFQAFGGVH
jgi:tight adherence protein C